VRPDGSVIADRPSHEQTSGADVPVTNPVFTDTKRLRTSIGGLAAGTILDFSWTTEDTVSHIAADFLSGWNVTTGRPTLRSRLILETPVSVIPRIRERNLSFPRRESVRGDKRVYTWATKDVAKPPEPEPLATDSNNTVFQQVFVSGPISWSDVARWYAALARGRETVTPRVAARAAELARGARSLDDSLRVLHRFVAQDVRYVSLSLGIGGYLPRLPDSVLTTGFGDCKDKTTLFIALARAIGVTAFPVPTAARGNVDPNAPSIRAFDHMIAAVSGPNGYQFTDLTAAYVPWGNLPVGLREEFGLIVKPDGSSESVKLPGDPSTRRRERVVTGELNEAGAFSGRVEIRYAGDGESLRGFFAQRRTSEAEASFLRATSNDVFPGGTADSLVAFDGKDLSAEPRFSFAMRGAQAATISGSAAVLKIPFDDPIHPSIIQNVESRVPRRFWISAPRVFGLGAEREELRVTLPAGWRARLPKNVVVAGLFGSYRSEYSQSGRELRIEREIRGVRGVIPPDRVNDLIAFLRQVAADNVDFIIIERGGAVAFR
jgi:hypothetical protein